MLGKFATVEGVLLLFMSESSHSLDAEDTRCTH